jgi:hypothetical protein
MDLMQAFYLRASIQMKFFKEGKSLKELRFIIYSLNLFYFFRSDCCFNRPWQSCQKFYNIYLKNSDLGYRPPIMGNITEFIKKKFIF